MTCTAFVISLVSLAVAVVATVWAILARCDARNAKRSTILAELVQQANTINTAIAQYKVPGPYSKDEFGESTEASREEFAAVFFHHINLLFMVYHNKKELEDKIVSAYENWAKKTFYEEWVKKSATLLKIWKKFVDDKDLVGKDFLDWLNKAIGTN